MNDDVAVGNVIAQQLGGVKSLRTMLGAGYIVGGKNDLIVRFTARARNGINLITVILERDDLYTVRFGRVRRANGVPTIKKVDELSGVYCDQLVSVIEERTGLALRLPRFASNQLEKA